MALTEKQERKIEAVLRYLHQYLEARFEQACRINPSMRRVRDDLMWHEMATVRQVLAEGKGFGPDKFVVVDILTSFDAVKKAAMWQPSDQHSIFSEIVSEAETEKQQAKMEGIGIRRIGDFYKAIDPSLEKAILLVQTWLWWDLGDAVDLTILDLQAERVAALRRAQMTPDLLAFYRLDMHNPTAELTGEDVVAFEVKRSRDMAQAFEGRRASEPGFQMIIKREATHSEALDSDALNLAQRLRAVEQIRRTNSVDPALRDHYAKIFQCSPEAVAADRVIAYEQEACAVVRSKMRSHADGEQALGEPYNFKLRQIELVRQKMARIEAAAKPKEG